MISLSNEWESIPTKEQYLSKNNLRSVICIYCKSEKTLDIGLSNMVDHRRKIICANCKVVLYREND